MNAVPTLRDDINRYMTAGGNPPSAITLHLAARATATVRQNLTEALAQHTLASHQAFDLLQHAVVPSAELALRQLVESSPDLARLLNEHVREPDKWYRETAQYAAVTAMIELRTDFTSMYGFPVVTPEAIVFLCHHLANREVLEVGAGNGYLASQLTQAGLNVFPTDAHGLNDNQYGLGDQHHTPVLQCDAATAIREFPELDLIWSWPCRDHSSGEALALFQGETFVYIGEQYGGCTGGDRFDHELDQHFQQVDRMPLPSFPPVHDAIGVYRRKQTGRKPTRRQHPRETMTQSRLRTSSLTTPQVRPSKSTLQRRQQFSTCATSDTGPHPRPDPPNSGAVTTKTSCRSVNVDHRRHGFTCTRMPKSDILYQAARADPARAGILPGPAAAKR